VGLEQLSNGHELSSLRHGEGYESGTRGALLPGGVGGTLGFVQQRDRTLSVYGAEPGSR
jgi:hypothetical protein